MSNIVIIEGKEIALPLKVILQDGREATLIDAPTGISPWSTIVVDGKTLCPNTLRDSDKGLWVKEYVRDKHLLHQLETKPVVYDKNGRRLVK